MADEIGKGLTAAEILAVDDMAHELVVVPEWGGAAVYVRTMTGLERDGFEYLVQSQQEGSGKFNTRGLKVELLILTVYDKARQLIFTAEDRDALSAKSAGAIERLFQVAQRLNGLSPKDIEELGG